MSSAALQTEISFFPNKLIRNQIFELLQKIYINSLKIKKNLVINTLFLFVAVMMMMLIMVMIIMMMIFVFDDDVDGDSDVAAVAAADDDD